VNSQVLPLSVFFPTVSPPPPPPPGGAARGGVGVGVGVGVEVEEEDEADAPQLLRTRSDASFMEVTRRRSKTRSNAHDLQRLRTHRFSINGHFYNHKVH